MNILVVSPAYAPYAGVGANRMMSFSQYMVEKGHSVIVLRNLPELWPAESLKSIPPEGVIVIDVNAIGTFMNCVEAYYWKIKEAYEQYLPDCAIYSCNPYYTIVAAARIKRETGAKFVIDFRDLWIKDEALTRSIPRKIKKFLSRIPYISKEKNCVEMADFIVTVSPRDCQQLQRQYRKHKNKMCVIYNGYDENRINKELSDEEKIKVDKVFKQIDGFYSIGVFGKFGYYDYEYVRQMLSAVKVLNEKGVKIKIVHIGELDAITKKAMDKMNFPNELYCGTGFLDYRTGIEILRGVTMNCLIVHYKRGLGTKLFDYMFVNKPVIYFAQKDSSIADILEVCNHSYLCAGAKDTVNAIVGILKEKQKDLGCMDRDKYSRTIQNERYEKLLENVII